MDWFNFYFWWTAMKNYEDEAFDELEQKLKKPFEATRDLNPYETIVRNNALEEVAQHIEHKFNVPFGRDTIASFACYIRGMKR